MKDGTHIQDRNGVSADCIMQYAIFGEVIYG